MTKQNGSGRKRQAARRRKRVSPLALGESPTQRVFGKSAHVAMQSALRRDKAGFVNVQQRMEQV